MTTVETMIARVASAEFTIADLCREAGIARSTFDRWARKQTSPNMKTWSDVEAAFERLSAKKEKAA